MSTSPGTDRATRHRDTEAIPPVRKSIHVPWSVERAFRRFTREIADWWPLSTYSVGEGKSDTVTFESRVGGRLFETLQDGTEAEWFRPDGDGTRVELVHTGWERIAEKPREMRDGYDSGWDVVLARFVEA